MCTFTLRAICFLGRVVLCQALCLCLVTKVCWTSSPSPLFRFSMFPGASANICCDPIKCIRHNCTAEPCAWSTVVVCKQGLSGVWADRQCLNSAAELSDPSGLASSVCAKQIPTCALLTIVKQSPAPAHACKQSPSPAQLTLFARKGTPR